MVLHHVVSTKELVLLLGGKAIYNEVVTEKDLVEALDRVFAKSRNLLGKRQSKLLQQFNSRQESHHTEE